MKCVRILLAERLFVLAQKVKPDGYELACLRQVASASAKSARNDVLMKMREPTPKMLKAASAALSPAKRPTQDWVSNKEKHRIRYQAMIDAAFSHVKGADQ